MKSTKIFELAYTINFIVNLGFVVASNILNYQNNYSDFIFILLFLSSIFLLIIVPFNWICYRLLKSYRTNMQLSKSYKILGTIFHVLFSLLTVLLIVGSIDLIAEYFELGFQNMRYFIFNLLFWVSTTTSVYLCISYWFIRNQMKQEANKLILQIGEENELLNT